VIPWKTGDPTFTPLARKPAIIGSNYHGTWWNEQTDTDRPQILDRLVGAGCTWVRLDVAWATIEPTKGSFTGTLLPKLDQRVNEIAERGLKCLVVFYWPPKWSSGTDSKNGVPSSNVDYANAAVWLLKRYAGKIHAIELWNEPDLTNFWNPPDPAKWARLVHDSYPIIKAAVPNTIVVAGAAAAPKITWHTTAFANGLAGSYDKMGAHLYCGMADAAPTTTDPKYNEYYPIGVQKLIEMMRANGDGAKKVWVTEYGWSAHTNATGVENWNRGTTAQNQALYLLQFNEFVAQFPEVEATFWYTDRNTASTDVHQANFGLLNRDNTPKTAWYAMRCAAGNVCK
jgi:hypothetical protein